MNDDDPITITVAIAGKEIGVVTMYRDPPRPLFPASFRHGPETFTSSTQDPVSPSTHPAAGITMKTVIYMDGIPIAEHPICLQELGDSE